MNYFNGNESNSEKIFDVCIIGGGPAGLATLSSIHNPIDVSEGQMRVIGNRRGNKKRPKETLSVCVVDPLGSFMRGWNSRFNNLDIPYLRSPCLAHPDSGHPNALAEFARLHGRESELRDIQSLEESCLKGLPDLSAGMFRAPSSALFKDFCDNLVETLPHEFVKATVSKVFSRNNNTASEGDHRKGEDDHGAASGCETAKKYYNIVVESSGEKEEVCSIRSSIIKAKRIVLAIGVAGKLNIPESLQGFDSYLSYATNPTLTFPKVSGKKILICGGGLSAVQSALRSVKDGAKEVTLVCRRPIQIRPFDIDVKFMDSRRGSSLLYDFHHTSPEDKINWIQDQRGGGSIPNEYYKLLKKESKIKVHIGEIVSTSKECVGSCVKLMLELQCCGGDNEHIQVDRVILGTGHCVQCIGLPLCSSLVDRFHLPVAGGLPILSEELQWGSDEEIYVIGSLAALQIGADAGNLMGISRAARTLARTFGVHDSLYEAGNVFSNPYGMLLYDDDSSSDEDENDEN